MEVDRAFSLIARAIDGGTAAHGYLVTGDVRGNCAELVRRVLLKLYPDARELVEAGSHPDVCVLEPEGKARIITVDAMRDRVVAPMAATAFAGGWKVGVIRGADRLRTESANAFLKTLEEPPPKTLFFLLTDAPDNLLPTIVSRCQRVDLKLPAGELDGEARAAVDEVMTGAVGEGVYARLQAGKRLAEILGELVDEADEADVAIVRKSFYRTILAHVRAWMEDGRIPRFRAYRNVEAVEEAYRRAEQHLPVEVVLTGLMDRLAFPPAGRE